jgi:glutamine amidotransferase
MEQHRLEFLDKYFQGGGYKKVSIASQSTGILALHLLITLLLLLMVKVIQEKTPILGICLGMQLFTKKSEEGFVDGLGWIDAETIRFRFQDNPNKFKIPHMGWNTITIHHHHPLLRDLGDQPRFYFVHSYHARCENPENIVALTEYGYPFPSVITRENIIGVQYHPERSHKFGMKILKNFIEG